MMYCAVQKNSVPAAADAVATSNTVFLLNRVQSCATVFIHSFAMFCYVFLCELRGPAWAVGSHSSSPPAGGIPQIIIFKTLWMTGWKALYTDEIKCTRLLLSLNVFINLNYAMIMKDNLTRSMTRFWGERPNAKTVLSDWDCPIQ